MSSSVSSLLLLLLLLGFPEESIGMSIATYKSLRKEGVQSPAGGVLRMYVRGLQDGLEWSNSFMKVQGKPGLFCAPENIALNTENYIQFIDESLAAPRARPLKETLPIPFVLLNFLQSNLPC